MTNSRQKVTKPPLVQTSIVVKSIAPSTSQCDWMNVFHVVCRFRSGTGSIPWAFKIIETCRQQRRNACAFVTAAVESHLAYQSGPSLLPRV
jgi:hypothetical protein